MYYHFIVVRKVRALIHILYVLWDTLGKKYIILYSIQKNDGILKPKTKLDNLVALSLYT